MPTTSDSLRAALSQLSEGVIVADAEGRVTFVNEAAERLHGVAALDIMPSAYAETYHLYRVDGSPFPSTELPLARAVLRGETTVDERWIVERPDGTRVFVIGSARPLRDAEQAQIGAVLTVRDDSARTLAAAARDERDALARRLHAAFEQTPISTVVYDRAGKPLAANPAFERLWGATLADVPPDYSVLSDPQLDAAGVLPLIRRAFAGEPVDVPPLRYEMTNAVGRGHVLWTQAHLYPVRDAEGRVEQVVLAHEDITIRRQAELELAEVAARAQRLHALAAALSMASTPAEVAEAVVERAKDALSAASVIVARLSPDGEKLQVMRVGELPADLSEQWRAFPVSATVPLADVVRTGEPQFIESRADWVARYPNLVDAVDAAGHHASAVTPLIADGRILGALGAAFESARTFSEADKALALTVAQQCAQALERARLFEAELVARQAAEAANRAKSDFLAVMSHELRTPLNAIGGYTELIEMGIRGPVTAEQLQDLTRIRASQRHLLGLINEVLNYAKLESGQVQYDFVDVKVCDALSAAEKLVAPQARAKGLALRVGTCAADLGVRADADKLQQILVNLLSNAVKFSESGSVELECLPEDDMVRITVRDSGIGIPPEQIRRIFEPFVQVRPDLTRTANGTGLGLAISRDLARAMSGELDVTSEPGIGSEFTLTLPISPKHPN